MQPPYDEYAAVANDLIEEIQEISPAAADCIEQIRAKYGTRAAYLAAFALVLYRNGCTRSDHSVPGDDLKLFIFYEEMHEMVEAIRLYKDAAIYLLAV
jgi:hypothetical protein